MTELLEESNIYEIKDLTEKNSLSNQFEELNLKIVIVGDSGVGKSNVIARYIKNNFLNDSKATVGMELSTKYYRIKQSIIKVNLWDTAGQERYKSITSTYYKGAKGAIIVYDITKRETFDNITKWYSEITDLSDKNISIMLLGNKSDLTILRSVEEEELTDLGNKLST